MEPKRAFINRKNKATFTCPFCGRTRVGDVSKFLKINKEIRVKHRCACGKIGLFFLERRQFYRKPVELEGVCWSAEKELRRDLKILDLSRSGIKMELTDMSGIAAGDRLMVAFRLDNKQRIMIEREVEVRLIKGNELGAEFTSRDSKNPIEKAYDLAIGYYTFT